MLGLASLSLLNVRYCYVCIYLNFFHLSNEHLVSQKQFFKMFSMVPNTFSSKNCPFWAIAIVSTNIRQFQKIVEYFAYKYFSCHLSQLRSVFVLRLLGFFQLSLLVFVHFFNGIIQPSLEKLSNTTKVILYPLSFFE